MTKTLTSETGLVGFVITVLVLAPCPASAQTTPWGDPDLQAVWTNQTPVPLERPGALRDKEFFTEEEAVEFERAALENLLRVFTPGGALETESDLSGELTEIWLDTQDGKVGPSRRTSLVIDPPNGRIPYIRRPSSGGKLPRRVGHPPTVA